MKTYTIDLALPDEKRWGGVIKKEKRTAKVVLEESLEGIPRWIRKITGTFYRVSRGPYIREIECWAKALNVSVSDVLTAHCSYELGMLAASCPRLAGVLSNLLFACTAAVVQHPVLGPVHVRHLDWPLQKMGKATRIFRFKKDSHIYLSAGITGFVGVLSGCVPGEYSVSMNQAPASHTPGYGMAGAFLLREVLSECRTYGDAVYALKHTPVAAPVLFLVCGTDDYQACVVERRKNDYRVRKMGKGKVLVVTNHHEARGWSEYNYMDQDVMDFSCERYYAAQERLSSPNATLSGVLGQLKTFPVYNENTCQRMAFNPRNEGLVVIGEK